MYYITYFANPENHNLTAKLVFKVHETGIAKRWTEALMEVNARKAPVKSPWRIYNFPDDGITDERICDSLNKCIEVVRKYVGDDVPEFVRPPLTHEDTNRLHRYFEKWRGSILAPSALFQSAGPELREAIENFNIYIHQYEDYRQRLGPSAARVVWTWADRPRYPLQEEDYVHFDVGRIFGRVYLNYSEVGKHLMEAFGEDDREAVALKKIVPQRFYSADNVIWFGRNRSNEEKEEVLRKFYQWWDEVQLDQLGFRKHDPKNALGRIPVADLIMPRDVRGPEDLVEKLSNYRWLLRASVVKAYDENYSMT